MHRLGHYGVSLAVYAPVGFALVLLGRPTVAVLAGIVVVWLAMLPDLDMRIPGVPHRGPTHSLLFAALVGTVFAGVGALVGGQLGLGERFVLVAGGFALGALTVLAHLVGDLLTPMGVNLFWPASSRRYSLSLTTADSTVWNYALFLVGVFAAATAFVLAIRVQPFLP